MTHPVSLIRIAYVDRQPDNPRPTALLPRLTSSLTRLGEVLVALFDEAVIGALQEAENGWRFDAAQQELALLAALAERAGIKPPHTFASDEVAWALREEWEPIARVVSHQLLRTAISIGDLLDPERWAKEALNGQPNAVQRALRGRDSETIYNWYNLAARAMTLVERPARPVIAFNTAWQVETSDAGFATSQVSPVFVLDTDCKWESGYEALDAEEPAVVVEAGIWKPATLDESLSRVHSGNNQWQLESPGRVDSSLVAVASAA